jgi:hypothetical protein
MKKISDAINAFVEQARRELKDDFDAKSVVSAIVATFVASTATLPSLRVGDPRDWYITNALPGVVAMLDEINEQFVINIPTAKEASYQFWLTRYSILHEPGSSISLSAMLSVVNAEVPEIAPVYATVINRNNKNWLTWMSSVMKEIYKETAPRQDR